LDNAWFILSTIVNCRNNTQMLVLRK